MAKCPKCKKELCDDEIMYSTCDDCGFIEDKQNGQEINFGCPDDDMCDGMNYR